MTKALCKLCLINVADKKNSHIIPKFLCKGLFASTSPRHTLAINSSGKGRKLQDTPKENHILCSVCEKKLEIIETYFSRVVDDIHKYSTRPEDFSVRRLGVQQFIECNNIHPTLYKLFIYSLVWRCSISNLFDYQNFKLSVTVEEELRQFLNSSLTVNKTDLFNSFQAITNIPSYHNCLIKPLEKSDLSRGIFTACNMSEASHFILFVDFGLFFYTDEESIGTVLRAFSNKQNRKVIVALAELTPWKELNHLVLSKVLGGITKNT